MKIDKNNYESMFIDYFDGKLSQEEKRELFLFLEKNPALKEEFESFENITLEKPTADFPEKNLLKKSQLIITRKNCEEYFIAYHENLLSAEDKRAVEKFVHSFPGLKKDFETYSKTRLENENALFSDKDLSLKKHSGITAENSDWWIISFIENTLTQSERELFEKELGQNADLQKELSVYSKTILEQPLSLFAGKENLKRKDRKIIPLFVRYTSYAAAACLLLFFGMKWLAPGETRSVKNTSALTRSVPQKIQPPVTENQPENFIAEKNNPPQQLSVPSENKNNSLATSPGENSAASTATAAFDPLEKINKKEAAVFSPVFTAKEIVTTIPFTSDSTRGIVAESEKQSITEKAFAQNNDPFLTPKQYLVQQFNKKILGKDSYENPTTGELTSMATEKISTATHTPVSVKNEKQEKGKTYGFSIGKFSFSRSR